MDNQRPLFLVTNDDGIDSPWITLLADHLAEVGEVIVSAPASEQSAVGNSISLNAIIRVNERGEERYAVHGTPTDAVLLGMSEFCPRPPDLVVSGINPGPNLGTDVFYSGTVAGAIQGAIRGVQGMAVSQELPEETSQPEALLELFSRTARFARDMARRLIATPLPANTVLNVNAPPDLAREFVWTRMGKRVYRENVLRRLDPRGSPYYWVGGPPVAGVNPPGTDGHAVEQGLISLTLLDLNLSADIQSWRDDFQPPGQWEQTEDGRSEKRGPSRR